MGWPGDAALPRRPAGARGDAEAPSRECRASGRSRRRAVPPIRSIPVQADHERPDVDVAALAVEAVAEAELSVEREVAGLQELDAAGGQQAEAVLVAVGEAVDVARDVHVR